MNVAEEYSFSLHGERFRLPGPKEYRKEFERLGQIVSEQRARGREIVVGICAKIKK
jgi:hypothetical protein